MNPDDKVASEMLGKSREVMLTCSDGSKNVIIPYRIHLDGLIV